METDEVIKLVDNIYKVSFIRSILLLNFEFKTKKKTLDLFGNCEWVHEQHLQ